MPDIKRYALTRLQDPDSLTLHIGNEVFPVSHMAVSYAKNEVPSASCVIPLGNSFRTGKSSGAGGILDDFPAMTPAFLRLRLRGEYDPSGRQWPDGGVTVFDGHYLGPVPDLASGKNVVTVHLIHFLGLLGSSSCLNRNLHPRAPGDVAAAAIMRSLASANSTPGAFLGAQAGGGEAESLVTTDLWSGIKSLFCWLAGLETAPTVAGAGCIPSEFSRNDFALAGLSRIEGPARGCNRDYRDGRPLRPETADSPFAGKALARAIFKRGLDAFYGYTFWDKLVGEYCPMFGLAVVPQSEKALVIADVPGYRGGEPWRTIQPDEWFSFNLIGSQERPVRAVNIYGRATTLTGLPNLSAFGTQSIGGCFAASDAASTAGVVMYEHPPPWLEELTNVLTTGAASDGGGSGRATGTSTTPLASLAGAGLAIAAARQAQATTASRDLFSRFAHTIMVNESLKGRSAAMTGPLRFDIAPGSIIKILGAPERAVNYGTGLKLTRYAQVNRVTISIDAETPSAMTSFQLQHVRTEKEQTLDRTSTTTHPLFTADSIHGAGRHGTYLVKDLVPEDLQ